MKILNILFVLFILMGFIPLVAATDLGQIQSNTTFNFSSLGVNITVLVLQNFSQIQYTTSPANMLEFTINGTRIQYNSSQNMNISNISLSSQKTLSNFTLTATSGTANISAQMLVASNSYPIFRDGVSYTTVSSDSNGWVNFSYSDWATNTHAFSIRQNFILYSPTNTSTQSANTVNLQWIENPTNAPYFYKLSTDNQFINIVSQGSGSANGTEGFYQSGNINLNYNTKYYWKVQNSTGVYLTSFEFTVSAAPILPGQLNITVFDEQNLTLRIMNFSVEIQNTSANIQTKSTTTGWTNFSGAEVNTGQYLITVRPTDTAYYLRYVLATSPANVTMYVPNSSSPNTINVVSFTISDITGRFPYTTTVITISRGGLVQQSSYFKISASLPAYLIQGTNYQVQLTNGNNIFSSNYIPIVSTTNEPIVINNFGVNSTQLTRFNYNITRTKTQVVLNWNDTANYLNYLNFTVYKNVSMIQQCNQLTSVKHGQSVCDIVGNDTFYVNFVAFLNDGTYQNNSFWFNNVIGQIPTSIGINPIDGSPMGTGFNVHYGTFTMPRWVLTLFTAILVILLLGTFGAKYGELGVVISTVFAVFFAEKGWFAPLGTDETSQGLVISLLTSLLVIFAISYIAKNNTGSTMMAYKITQFLIFTNFAMAITDAVISPLIFPQTKVEFGTTDSSLLGGLANSVTTGATINIAGVEMSLSGLILTATTLALFAFSLLPVMIPIINALFSLSFVFTAFYIVKLGLSTYFTAPLIVGVAIIYLMGMTQFASRQTAQGV